MKLTPFLNPDKNLLLLNTMYIGPYYEFDINNRKKKVANDFLYMVYRDLDTGEKGVLQVEDPQIDTFITKPEFRGMWRTQRKFVEEHKVDRYSVPYSRITNFIRNMIKEDGRDVAFLPITDKAPKEAFKWRHAYCSDVNICDYAMVSYLTNHQEFCETGMISNMNVTKAFLDIEADVYGLTTLEMDEGKGPINAVSVVITHDKLGVKYDHPKVYTYLLRNHTRYKQQKFFEENLETFVEECHQEFDEKYHEPEFIIQLFDSERELLRNLFRMLHSKSPDFILIWNMGYDIPKIMSRLVYLGEDPKYYFCHKDFKRHMCQYNYDNIYKNDFKNKNESFDCTCYSTYVDQMLNYAGIRKSKSEYGGNSLDNVAHIELRAEKRRYSKNTVTVLNGAIEEYWNFVKYSINDVLLQYGIDEKTGDLGALFDQSMYGGTRISKTLKQSVYLKNVYLLEYLKMNIVPGNNLNVNYLENKNEEHATDIELYRMFRPDGEESDTEIDHDDMQLPGALVGDPKLNSPEGVRLYGEKSAHYYKDVVDFDFTAEYPNAKITANIAPHTQWGRLIIPEKILPNENPDNNPKFMRGGKFIEDYTTGDWTKLGAWFNLPTSYEVIKKYEKYLINKQKWNSTATDNNGYVLIRSRKNRPLEVNI